MHATNNSENYDKIILSFKEKRILHRILRKKKVPEDFFNSTLKSIFLQYGLIRIQQEQKVTPTGRVIPDANAPKCI